jgi:hypothetical protein
VARGYSWKGVVLDTPGVGYHSRAAVVSDPGVYLGSAWREAAGDAGLHGGEVEGGGRFVEVITNREDI